MRERPPRRSRLRWLPAVLVLLAVLGAAGLAFVRSHLEEWTWTAVRDELARSYELRAEVAAMRIDLVTLRLELTDLQVEPIRADQGTLRLHVDFARLRLSWRGLVGLGRRRLDLAELRVVRPTLQTDEAFLSARRPERASSAEVPIDFFVEQLDLVSGRWVHEGVERELELTAEQVFVVGNWAGDRRTMLGDIGLRFAVLADPLERHAELDVTSRFRWRGRSVELIGTRVRGAGIDAEADLLIDPARLPLVEGRGRFTADLDRLDAHMGPGFPDVGGKARGTFQLALGPEPVRLSGEIVVADARVDRFAAAEARSEVLFVPGRLEFRGLDAAIFGGRAGGSIDVALGAPSRLTVDVRGTALDTRSLLDWLELPLPLAGEVDAALRLEGRPGDLAAWRGEGTFRARARPGSSPGRVAVGGEGRVGLEDGRLRVEVRSATAPGTAFEADVVSDLRARPASGRLELKGRTHDAARTQGVALTVLERLDAALPAWLEQPVVGAGEFETQVDFGGQPRLALELRLAPAALGSHSFDRIDLALTLADEELTLQRLVLLDGEGSLAGAARLRLEPLALLAADVEARRVEAAALLQLIDVDLDLEGQLTGTLRAEQVGGILRGNGLLRLGEGRLLGKPLDEIRTRLEIEGDLFRLDDLEVAAAAVSGQGSAVLDQVRRSATLRIDRAVVDLEGLALVDGIGARLELSGELDADEQGPRGELTIGGGGLRAGRIVLGRFDGRVAIDPLSVTGELRGADEASWIAEARIGLGEGFPLAATARLDDAVFELPIDGESPLWTTLSGYASVEGPLLLPAQWQVRGEIERGELQLGAHRVELESAARIDVSEQRLSIGPVRLGGALSDFSTTVAYDLADGELDVTARGGVGLRLLSALLPEVRASGTAEIDASVRGTIDAPLVTGSLVLEGGRVRYLGFPHTLEQVDTRMVLRGSEATIEEFHALIGGGEIEGRGRVEIGPAGPRHVELDLAGSNVRIALPDGFVGVYEGTLKLAGSPQDLLLAGQLNMLRGVYDDEFQFGGLLGGGTREYSSGSVAGPLAEVQLDLLVRADGNVWVRNDVAEIESAFELRVGGTVARPEITGRLALVEGGTLRFRDVAYRIRNGSLEFTDPEGINPYIFVNAWTSVSSYEISLRVEGTLEQLEYDLSSSPSLSQQDIIAVLTTGKTLKELTGGQAGSNAEFTGDLAASYFAGALTDRFERQLQQALGLDVFQINPLLIETADPTTRLTVGKRVSDDVLVIVSADLRSTEDRLYVVEWRANPKLLVNFKQDVNGGLGSDVLYTNRFWWRKPRGAGHEAAVPASVPRTAPEQTAPTPRVRSVEIRGLPPDERASVEAVIPFGPGADFNRSRLFRGVEALRRHFVARERLQARVAARATPDPSDPREVDVVYDVERGPQIEVAFVGLQKKEERRLRSALERVWAESLFTDDLYTDSVQRILEDLQSRGYYGADVDYRVEAAPDGLRVNFLVDRGRAVRVGKVSIAGAEAIAEDRVRRQMLTRPPALFGGGHFDPAVLRDDRAAIRNLYLDQGFLDVGIEEPRLRLSAAGDVVDVALQISEGPRYVIRSLTFAAADAGVEEARLREWSGLAPGQTFSRSELLAAEARLRRAFDALGHPAARVRGRAEPDPRGEVDLTLEIASGPRMRVAAVRLSGNQLTRDHVILNELQIEVGELISREQILRAQHRLYRLDVFRNVRITYEPLGEDDPAACVLNVELEEDRPLTLTAGVGWNTEAKFRFTFATAHENLHGRARSFGFQGEVSQILQRIQFLARSPRLFGAAVPALGNVLWEHEDREGFSLERRSTALRVERQLNKPWRAFLRYNFQRVDIKEVIDPGEVLEAKLEDVKLGDVGVGLFHVTVDSLLLPTRGNYLTTSLRVFARPLLSERSFVKAQVSEQHTWALGRGWTFVTFFRVGIAPTFGSTEQVPISERFFAGGDSTNRGFARDRLGPTLRDVFAEDEIPEGASADQPVGGEALLLLNQEFRFPLWPSIRLKGVAFYDAGNVYLAIEDFDPLDLRHTLGLGLRLETPIGPLRAEYGWKLDRRDGETPGQFFVAIGTVY